MGQLRNVKALLIGCVVIAAWLVGADPSAALPNAVLPSADRPPILVIPVRHHHHHHWHWHHRFSRDQEYDAPESDAANAQNQTGPDQGFSAAEAASITPPPANNGSGGGTNTRPSTRWVNPDRSGR